MKDVIFDMKIVAIGANASNNNIFCATLKKIIAKCVFRKQKKVACNSLHRSSNFPDQFPGNQLSAFMLVTRMHMRPIC